MTKESVVRRELLFAVGEKLDPEKIIETERNLRLNGFIGEANITAKPDSADGVDILVVTSDLWTSKVSIYVDLAGGKYATGVDLTEQNLLGYGKMIDVLGQVGNDQDGYHAIYLDNRLIGSRIALGLSINDFTYENGFSLSLSRPQYSLSVPTSFAMSYSRLHSRPRLFFEGKEYFRYRENQEDFRFESSYTFGRFRRLSIIAGGFYKSNKYSPDQIDSPLNSLIPSNEIITAPSAGLSGALVQYDVERYLDAPGTPEDLTLGAGLKITLSKSLKSLGATYTGLAPAFTAQFLGKLSEHAFIGGSEQITWWHHNGRNERFRHITEAAFYYKPLTTNVLVLHTLTDFAWRQKSAYQVYLGGGNGLRGHSFYEFAGTKLALANVEYRFYTPIEILTVRLGFAGFFDIGNVWRYNEHIRFGDLKSDVGLGLRFGLTRSSTSRVVNFDVARALTHYGLYVTFSSSTSMFRLSNINIQ
ncbi:MAG TPA: hypothetical protein DEO84_01815 [candidate division Zixibacteria bacterium]|nr:hypothetical protein [candidate division Zixibacteria bacterium]